MCTKQKLTRLTSVVHINPAYLLQKMFMCVQGAIRGGGEASLPNFLASLSPHHKSYETDPNILIYFCVTDNLKSAAPELPSQTNFPR